MYGVWNRDDVKRTAIGMYIAITRVDRKALSINRGEPIRRQVFPARADAHQGGDREIAATGTQRDVTGIPTRGNQAFNFVARLIHGDDGYSVNACARGVQPATIG